MRARPETMAPELKIDELETFGEQWGDQYVRHINLPAGTDLRPLLKGLPNDECQCPHWGYVFSGSITLRYSDGTEETTAAGEAYYWPGGHTAWTNEGVVFLEFNPADEIRPVLDHLGAQLTPSN